MITFQKIIGTGLVLASVGWAMPVWASDDVRDQALKINSANSLLRSGDIDGAITAYQQAQEVGANSADLSYNMAVAQYRKGDVLAAEHLFQAAAAAENDALAAKARYNLGNCKFASAVRDSEKDRPTAIKSLESAIANYRSSLDINPTDADARANIERAAALIEKLRKEDKKEQQAQQRQNAQQEQRTDDKQDDSQPSNSQQQKNKQQSQGNDKQQSQDRQQQQQKSQSSSQGENKDNQAAQSKQPGDQSTTENPSQDKSQQQNQSDAAQKEQQQAPTSQESSQSQPNKSHAQSADEQKQQDVTARQQQSQQNRRQRSANKSPEQMANSPPDQPTDQQGKTPPKGALTAAGKDDTKADNRNEQEVPVLDSAKDGEMTLHEAQKMLQSIRDRDMLRRLRRQAAERDRHVPVDRDW